MNKVFIKKSTAVDSFSNESVEKAKEIWKECLNIIKEHTGNLAFKTWFAPIQPVSFENNTLIVKVPNSFSWEYIEVHYNTLLKKTLLNVIGDNAKLKYIVDSEKLDEDSESIQEKIVFHETQTPLQSKKTIEAQSEFETHLNEKFTFDNFIKGEGNQLARAAAFAVANSPGGTSFNPLFIYGGVGLGKTHLIQAIGNYAIAMKKARRVLYTTAEKFTLEYVESIKKNSTNTFSSYYRTIDILIIDDVQFFAGKESTTDTFFHIFNSLHQIGKQIVLSCDRPPKSLSGLDDRLISRFQWGLLADIQPPDLETRIAILMKKSESFGLEINPQIIEYIATHITNNIRELEGCLVRILALASLEGKEINFDLAKEVVKSIATDKKFSITIDQIQKTVCEYFEIPDDMIRSKNKKQEFVLARQVAMFLCKKYTNASLKTIGLHFGGRDHSTVIHSIQMVEESLLDEKFSKIINSLQRKLELNS
ncbi:MAG: chromosomal replication initiator protein DnaA [Ignavibacteria bacterium]|nr:chromosomal replication initiator protein DnaA [Ignavibacteria bacterium]